MAMRYARSMADYDIKLVDAFTTTRYAGNPCGVVTSAEGLSDEQMQAIAREINASETVFAFPSNVATAAIRFFTPGSEIPMAGHPTISVWHAMAEDGRIDLGIGTANVTQETRAGVLPVAVRHAGDAVEVTMTQAEPTFLAPIDKEHAMRALELDESAFEPGAPLQVVSTGTPQAMVMVRGLDVLRKIKPDFRRLADLEQRFGAFSCHVFTLETLEAGNRAHSRHFAANAGIPEDPVTGSATGGMAAYLWRYGFIRESAYVVEQGDIMGRPGRVRVEVEGSGGTPRVVRIAGSAVTVLRGKITV